MAIRCLFMDKLYYYNLSLEELEKIKNYKVKPKLLLHVCCGPCSAFPLMFLNPYFDITIYYNNSNIFPSEEYYRRLEEMKKFVDQLNNESGLNIKYIIPNYDEEEYSKMLSIYKDAREGGERCFLCYRLRLEEAYEYAVNNDFDYVTTVMTVSSQKNSIKLNEIGLELQKKYPSCKYFVSDFKKKQGADVGRRISNAYGLYRQQYCGCRYSYYEYLKRIESLK